MQGHINKIKSKNQTKPNPQSIQRVNSGGHPGIVVWFRAWASEPDRTRSQL